MADPCFFLDKLPAELRNTIYEMAFTSNDKGQVEISEAKPPTHALVMTCKQIYTEAVELYKTAHLKYWSETRFHILNHRDSRRWTIRPLRSHLSGVKNKKDLDLINHLTITITHAHPHEEKRIVYELLDKRGAWTFVTNREPVLGVWFCKSPTTTAYMGGYFPADEVHNSMLFSEPLPLRAPLAEQLQTIVDF